MSAADIITYIGVPLAVLGVTPILAVVIKTLLFSIRIRRQLRENLDIVGLHQTPFWNWPFGSQAPQKRKAGIWYYSIDVDVLAGQVNISYPVLRLEVIEPKNDLYRRKGSRRSCSRLKGGTWTCFYFRVQLVPYNDSTPETEPRTYILRPTDRLCQRPALIQFQALVKYLLDLGAVACRREWANLYRDGLKVANRTKLLETKDSPPLPVLVVRESENEEDDRLLAVLLDRDGVSRLFAQPNRHPSSLGKISIQHVLQPRQPLTVSHDLYRCQIPPSERDPIQIEMSETGIGIHSDESRRTDYREPGDVMPSASSTTSPDQRWSWLSIGALIIAARDRVHNSLVIPDQLSEFLRNSYTLRPSIPCGVLQTCGLLHTRDCIPWAPEDPATIAIPGSRTGGSGPRPTWAQDKIIRAINGVPIDVIDAVEKHKVRHALDSPRWTVDLVARHMKIKLREQFEVDENASATTILEMIMYRMIRIPAEAEDICGVLDHWHRWYIFDALGAEDVEYLREHKTAFILAACVLGALGEYVTSEDLKTPDLLEECLKKWEDVLIY